ncbi:uncharacterized protein LTR77_007047 [Saxophila tyrrhenica]|uniref:Laccase n=1 Tax=Saxophila tyrrhenica TaxID=1690608 RepID=A0AAV9P3K7_9PEZI|nr:hypothetical protein LTR77_007047 [Saxophila tyrrhenica]
MAGRLIIGVSLLVSSVFAVPGRHRGPKDAVVKGKGQHPANTVQIDQPSPKPSPYGGPARGHFHSPAFLPHGEHSLRPGLSQHQTNGESPLGTHKAPHLPPFLGGSPLPHGRPWGGRTAGHTNQYKDTPNTGVTRHYDFTISEQDIAPDGFSRPGMVVNGAFPGPTIEANWGDWIEVNVHNQLSDEGTALHWHGLLQSDTPWFDGVPSVMQCPIAPGSSFTYRFRADLYGSSFYHSHYSAQYTDGILGPMIIYGPHEQADYDVDLGPVLLTDWYHDDYFTLVEQVMAPASEGLLPPVSQNNLINGKMNYPCANDTTNCTPNAGISKFYVKSGQSYRLRLINGGAEGIQKFSVDGYKLKIIQNDYVPIVPYEVDVVTLAIGQRADVILEANGDSKDAVWMRSTLGPSAFDGGCTLNDGVSPEAVAAIYYEDADDTALPTTTSLVSDSEILNCDGDSLEMTVPYFSITPDPNPPSVQQVDITFQTNGTHNLFFMNNSTFRANYNDPLLLEAKLGHSTFPAESNVYNFGESSSIRLVVYNYATTGVHPMHMHGHNMYVLAQGQGTWDGSVVNAKNPQRRDVQILPNGVSETEPGYIVVQIDGDNPGVWPFHCHIAWHVSAGLYINLLEGPEQIKKDMPIPSIMAQTCRDWSAWTGDNIPNEIDSGL